MQAKHLLIGALIAGLVLAGVPSLYATPAAKPARSPANFDGDGHDDLAVGAPYEDLGSSPILTNAGIINVLYGASGVGLASGGDDLWNQNSTYITDTAEAYDNFGFALAAADFGDGYADLAVGVPYEDIGSIDNAGAVNAIYGSADGLTSAGNQLWHQNIADIEGGAEQDDEFGYVLAAIGFWKRYKIYLPTVLRNAS